ncbi:MAG: respiratory nitrate reductase subunit gamma, partial [Acidimicrobiia bacterium]
MTIAPPRPTEDQPTASRKPLPRPRPSQFVMVVGILAALGTLASGVAPEITGWHPSIALPVTRSNVTREVFGNIPSAVVVMFYCVVAAMLVVTASLIANRVRNYERGRPDNRRTTRKNVARRMRDFRRGVWMQTLLRDPAAGAMHSMLYFGFIGLLIATIVLEIDHQMPPQLQFLHGSVYQGYSFVADAAGLIFMVGIVWAFLRRYVQRPYRIRIKTKPEHLVILITFFVIAKTGFAVEAARIALAGRPAAEKWSFIGYPSSWFFEGMNPSTLSTVHRWLWVAHFAAFVVFLVILPTTMLRHMVTSPMNMWWRDRARPKGAMKPMPNLIETELDTFGAVRIEDFTWKQLFDTDACTVCG